MELIVHGLVKKQNNHGIGNSSLLTRLVLVQ